jgi:hypothetical protein
VLSIFNIFIYSIFYMILSFHVCWDCVIELDFMLTEALDAIGVPGVEGGVEFDQICIIHGYRPWGADNAQGLGGRLASTPTGIFFIISFMILIMAMGRFIDWVVQVMSTITGSGISVTRAADTAMKEGVATGVDAAQTGIGVAKETASVARSAAGGVAGMFSKRAAAGGGASGVEKAGGGGEDEKKADRPDAAGADKLGKAGGGGKAGEKAKDDDGEEKPEGAKRSEGAEGAAGSEESSGSEDSSGSDDGGSSEEAGGTSDDSASSNDESGGDTTARSGGNSDIASAVSEASESAASAASSAGGEEGGGGDAVSTDDMPDTGGGEGEIGDGGSDRTGTAGTSVARAGVEAISSSGLAKQDGEEKDKKDKDRDK